MKNGKTRSMSILSKSVGVGNPAHGWGIVCTIQFFEHCMYRLAPCNHEPCKRGHAHIASHVGAVRVECLRPFVVILSSCV
jgi:hypothetical protein